MADKELNSEELENQNGEALPDREAMSILPIDGGFSIPADPDLVAPAASDGPPVHTLPVEPTN